jgi:hypothetical protein
MNAKLERIQQTIGGYATQPFPIFLMRHFPVMTSALATMHKP